MTYKTWKVTLFLSAFLFSCSQDHEIVRDAVVFKAPESFPEPVYTSEKFPFSKECVELGKKLFYDPILSIDNTISCGNCHAQSHAFSDHNTALSTGVNDLVGTRNSPALINLAWQPYFMHDGGVNHIEVFPIAPITNPVEMSLSIAEMIDKLSSNSAYRSDFQNAFETDSISSDLVFVAIAQFQSTLISANSKYDKYVHGEVSFSSEEKSGLDLFESNCASCHKPPLFTDYSFVNNGLDYTFNDAGRALVSQKSADSGKFKVPTLRNIALTNPYMHNGRFMSLDEVINHYSEGVKENGYLGPRLNRNLNLSDQEKADLITFLQTLTDYEFISNPDFSE